MSSFFSPRQEELIGRFLDGELRRINIVEGAVRSGKTWITVLLWGLWVATMPADCAFLMCGKTLTSLRRNVLDLLAELVGRSNFDFVLSRKEGELFGRQVYLEGASDARAEAKIRGMTLAGAYCDELTLFDEDFFSMLLSRLSAPGAKLIATTNPDNPHHWLYRKFIQRADEIDLFDAQFSIDDNVFLDPEYVEQIKREYTGVFYDRFILGRWVQAEGLIYDFFGPAQIAPAPEKCTEWIVSMDYGTQNPTAMILWGKSGPTWYAVDEYYYSGRDERHQKTDEDYYTELERLAEDRPVARVIVDPSAASMIATIRQHGRFIPRKAQNAVLDGIRTTASALRSGAIKICPACKKTIEEFGVYAWDKDAPEDRPLKTSDHAMDAVRYFVMDSARSAAGRPVVLRR